MVRRRRVSARRYLQQDDVVGQVRDAVLGEPADVEKIGDSRWSKRVSAAAADQLEEG
jgi:hypothetical protein